MKTTYQDALKAIRSFNASTAKTQGEAPLFFERAITLFTEYDGMRVSDVLEHADYQGVVLQVNTRLHKRKRFVAVWRNGRGSIVYGRESMPLAFWKMMERKNVCTAFPQGVATRLSDALQDEMYNIEAGIRQPTAAPQPASQLRLVETASAVPDTRRVPESDLPLSYRMTPVFRRLVPAKAVAYNILVNAEALASKANNRRPMFLSGDKGMDLLRGGEFPRDALNILEHEVIEMLKHKGLDDLEAVLDNPALIPLAA